MTRELYDLCGIDERLRFSPYCWRARYALAHKGLDVQTRPWRFSEKEALAFSGQGQVPVLVDGDEVVHDSYEIMRYLDRAYPESPLLGEGAAEARARFFKHYAERSLAPAILRTVVMDLFNAIHPDDRAYFRETREARLGCSFEEFHSPAKGLSQLDTALAPLRGRLEEADFLDGDAPGAPTIWCSASSCGRTASPAPIWSPTPTRSMPGASACSTCTTGWAARRCESPISRAPIAEGESRAWPAARVPPGKRGPMGKARRG